MSLLSCSHAAIGLLLLLSAAMVRAEPPLPPEPFNAQMSSQLDAYISDFMRRAKVPGAAVAIVQDGKTVYAKGFGVRELGKPDPVTPATLMMIGSTGKSMTTMMMASLADEGKITWDTPAVKIYPDFAVSDPGLTSKVTLRNTVCNCSGAQRHDLEIYFVSKRPTAEEVVRSLRSFLFVGEFGKTFGYINQMFGSGGYIAAWSDHRSGEDLYASYLVQMQKRVFDPIGMASTTFSSERVRANPNHASPHGQTASSEYVPVSLDLEKPLEAVAPAGGSWSNVRDMARYLMTQLSRGVAPDGKRVVSAENLKVTWQPHVEIQPGADYGLGWVITRYQGQPLLSHGGGTAGFTSDLSFLPDAKLGIVILTNAQNANLFGIAVRSRVLELAFGRPMEMDAKLAPRLEQAGQRFQQKMARFQPLDPATVASRLGSYTNPALGKVELSRAGDKLILAAGGFKTELRSLGDGNYVLWDPPLAGALIRFSKDAHEFTFDADDPDVPEKYPFTKGSAPRADHHAHLRSPSDAEFMARMVANST